jgi:hypothetical protein
MLASAHAAIMAVIQGEEETLPMRKYFLWIIGCFLAWLLANSQAWAAWVQDGGSLNINATRNAGSPALAMDNSTPYVVWSEYNGSKFQAYVKHWNGSGWEQNGGSLNVNTAVDTISLAIATDNSTPYVCWTEDSATQLLYVKHFNGSWVQDGSWLNGSYSAVNPSIAVTMARPMSAGKNIMALPFKCV